jgi:hypothetical protein
MEGLFELVAASLARHGVECPARECSQSDSELATAQPIRPAEPSRATELPGHHDRKSSQTGPTP